MYISPLLAVTSLAHLIAHGSSDSKKVLTEAGLWFIMYPQIKDVL